MKPFDLTPDPKVLIALTHTPLRPIDAISELIDNGIDSIIMARNSGESIEYPVVLIELPTQAQMRNGNGTLKIRDNGLGMSLEMAEKALKAGYSGNNPYDSLGLFGMGLNISTGKLGQRTTLITARRQDEFAVRVVVDLLKIQEQRSYEVIPELINKPRDFEHGTIIEISGWWPEGSPNSGFIKKLISYGGQKIRKEIGRRYSTIIREKKVRILVDHKECVPFEFCIWGDHRFVERQSLGKIPAVFRFTQRLGAQARCSLCFALIPQGSDKCQVCGSSSLRTLEETVRGWVGIQRFDDESHFGIDLIRNGRVIRLLEKSAFFEFTDEFGKTIKDYPADSIYGRIVGEVHLDFVPVDFMKQDFQRSSPEWQKVMEFLRGNSSLQPRQPGADENQSPIYKLFQGYRRVRQYGKHDMYMGYWDDQSNCAKRIDRQTEKDYYEKFESKLPGYYDDYEWWKLVESADTKPPEKLKECPNCNSQILDTAEICEICGYILITKECLSCKKKIPLSAVSCQYCAAPQAVELEEPWLCVVCGENNNSQATVCVNCNSVKGTLNPFSPEYLRMNSTKDDNLSIHGCSIQLPDDSYSQSVDVDTYITSNPLQNHNGERVPLVFHKHDKIDIYIDLKHPVYQLFSIRPEVFIAFEVADYIYKTNSRFIGNQRQNLHTVSNIQFKILNQYWQESLIDNAEKVNRNVTRMFNDIQQKLPDILREQATEIFDELSEQDKKILVANLIEQGQNIGEMTLMRSDGRFLRFVHPHAIVEIFKSYAHLFFNRNIWNETYGNISGIPDSIMETVNEELKKLYLNCLEDCSSFLNYKKPDLLVIKRTRNSLDYLLRKFEY